MNKLHGNITDIKTSGNLSLIHIEIEKGVVLKSIVIDTPDTARWRQIGNNIQVLFKEFEVVLGTDAEHSISMQNRLPGTIRSIEKGSLLSRIVIAADAGEIRSVISTASLEHMRLEKGQRVVAMVNLNEVMISQ